MFISRFETPVDLQSTVDLNGKPVDPVSPITLRMTPQIIPRRLYGEFSTGVEFNISDADGYIQFGPDHYPSDELEDNHLPFTAFNPEKPFEFYTVKEAGEHEFDFRIVMSGSQAVQVPPGDVRNSFRQCSAAWDLYFQINDETPIAFTAQDVEPWPIGGDITSGAGWTEYTYSASHPLKVGDHVRVYGQEKSNLFTIITIWTKEGALYRIFGGGGTTDLHPNETGYKVPSYFDVVGQTTYPETDAPAFFAHDVASAILARIGLGDQAFYSEVFGSPITKTRQYNEYGCYSNFALLKGLHIRGYTLEEKHFFISFKDWWELANPIFNLGLGYEKIEGKQVIRVEQKEHFLNTTPSVVVSNVRDISYKYDQDHIHKRINVGYKEWEAESAGGIDDPQTKRTYATRLRH